MLVELLMILGIVCLGLLAAMLFIRFIRAAFKVVVVVVLVAILFFVVSFFWGLF